MHACLSESESETVLTNPHVPYKVVHWDSFQADFDQFYRDIDALSNESLFEPWWEPQDWEIFKIKSHYDLSYRVLTIRNSIKLFTFVFTPLKLMLSL